MNSDNKNIVELNNDNNEENNDIITNIDEIMDELGIKNNEYINDNNNDNCYSEYLKLKRKNENILNENNIEKTIYGYNKAEFIKKCVNIYNNYKFPEDYFMYNDYDEDELKRNFKDAMEFYIKKNYNDKMINYLYEIFDGKNSDTTISKLNFLKDKFGLEIYHSDIKMLINSNPGQSVPKYVEVNLDEIEDKKKEIKSKYKNKDKDYDKNLDIINSKIAEENKKYEELGTYQVFRCDGHYKMNNKFDNNFDVYKSDEYKYESSNKQFNAQSFGFVIYMSKHMDLYDDNNFDNNVDVHIPHTLHVMMRGVIFYLFNILGANRKLKYIALAHEHGNTNKKCHIQGMVIFDKYVKCRIMPGSFIIDYPLSNENLELYKEYEYLIMFQSAKNIFKLKNYIKKKDILVPYNKFKEFNFTDNNTLEELLKMEINSYQEIEENKNIIDKILTVPLNDLKDLHNLLLNSKSKDDKKFILSNFKKILDYNRDALQDNNNIEFKWNFPKWALEYLNNFDKLQNKTPQMIDKYNIFHNIHKWYEEYCVNNNPDNHDTKSRKKALIVYGKRGLGKTLFFQNFCCDVDEDIMQCPYIVYCRNNVAWDSFKNKKNTAQLLILDDVNYIQKQKELIKALIVGGSTQFESKFIDKEIWDKNIPCVILTNNINLFTYFYNSDEFSNDCIMIGLDIYMGPPGTEPKREKTVYLMPNIKEQVDKITLLNEDKEFKEYYEEFQNTKKNRFKVFK